MDVGQKGGEAIPGLRIQVVSYFINENHEARSLTSVYQVPLASMGMSGDVIRQNHLNAQNMAADALGGTIRPMTDEEIGMYEMPAPNQGEVQ